MILRRKMEESQRKLVQLQEYHANLIGMQHRVRERLNEARQAQQALLQQENQAAGTSTWEGNNRLVTPLPTNVEELQSETAALRGKLTQLQSKKKHMDHLLAELQVVEMSDRASCVSIYILVYDFILIRKKFYPIIVSFFIFRALMALGM